MKFYRSFRAPRGKLAAGHRFYLKNDYKILQAKNVSAPYRFVVSAGATDSADAGATWSNKPLYQVFNGERK